MAVTVSCFQVCFECAEHSIASSINLVHQCCMCIYVHNTTHDHRSAKTVASKLSDVRRADPRLRNLGSDLGLLGSMKSVSCSGRAAGTVLSSCIKPNEGTSKKSGYIQ